VREPETFCTRNTDASTCREHDQVLATGVLPLRFDQADAATERQAYPPPEARSRSEERTKA
jgi:hypothetical protein